LRAFVSGLFKEAEGSKKAEGGTKISWDFQRLQKLMSRWGREKKRTITAGVLEGDVRPLQKEARSAGNGFPANKKAVGRRSRFRKCNCRVSGAKTREKGQEWRGIEVKKKWKSN